MSEYTTNLNLFKYTSDDSNQVFSFETALNDNWDKIDIACTNNQGNSRNIGEIVQSTIPLNDAGLHLLDGGLVSNNGIYDDFINYVSEKYNNSILYKWYALITDTNTTYYIYTKTQTIGIGTQLYDENGNEVTKVVAKGTTGCDWATQQNVWQYDESINQFYLVTSYATATGSPMSYAYADKITNSTLDGPFQTLAKGHMFLSPTYTDNLTITGSLANKDGVITGFGNKTNYFTLPTGTATESIDLSIKFNSGDFTTSLNQDIIQCTTAYKGMVFRLVGYTLKCWISSNGSSWNIASGFDTGLYVEHNTDYTLRISWYSGVYHFSLSQNGSTTLGNTIENANPPRLDTIHIGSGPRETYYMVKNIDIKESYFIIDNNLIWRGRTYYSQDDLYNKSIMDYGVCGNFIYYEDSGNVRLPKISGFIEGAPDVSELGLLTEAGLPDHTHNVTAFYWNSTGNKAEEGRGDPDYGQNLSRQTTLASESNHIYGNSNTVQPQSIKVLYYIVLANVTKTQVQIDIDNVVTDLNNKADTDLSNCTKPHIIENYRNGTSWYCVYSDGLCEQGGICTSQAYNTTSQQVTFLKPYINTDYMAITCAGPTTQASWQIATRIAIKTTTGLDIRGGANANTAYTGECAWYTRGYITQR